MVGDGPQRLTLGPGCREVIFQDELSVIFVSFYHSESSS